MKLLKLGAAALVAVALSTAPAFATGPSTRDNVLGFLRQITGNHVVSGVHNKEPLSNPAQYTAQAHSITGKWPGLWGGELGFTATDIANRQTMVNQAKTEWANGSLVNLTWHMCRPDVATCQFDGGVNGSRLSDPEWQQLITNGTSMNNDYKAKLDTAVPYFQQLKDAGIPVLFRPLHEMNEGWAWWGGRPGANGSARLFQITHDYLVSKGLTNIIWVWNVKDTNANNGSAGVPAFYPGDNYVDVASLDPWDHGFPTGDWYQALVNVSHGKPISLAEVGTVPSPSQLATQPKWTWFMIWSEYLTSANSAGGLQATFNSSRVLSQGRFTTPSAGGTAPAAPPGPAGVTAADEIAYLKGLTGNHVLSGQQGGANSDPAQWVRKVHDITGDYPAIWNGDFGFSQNDIDNRQTVINEAESEWANGSLPGLMMHACRPDVATCDFEGGANPVKGSHMSDPEWQQLITNGSVLNNDYKRKLDQFVPYFQQLKDAGIPVLFRPLHEMNEGWAWWGGRPGPTGSAKLFQITHDYLTSKGLDNIIWVWALKDVSGGTGSAASYYPGGNYVDVVGLDVWLNKFPSTDWYNAMQNIAGGKPMALAEVGSVPQPAQLSAQPKWVYWNVWLDYLTNAGYNSTDSVKAGYYDSRVLSRGAVHIPGGGGTPPPSGGAITGVGGKCVDVAGAQTVNGTVVQLYTCNGSDAQSWTVPGDGTLRALGKCLDVTGQGAANGTKIQLWDCDGSGAQQWVAQSDGRLKNPQSGRVLDDPAGSTTDGTRLQIWDANGNAWQVWRLPS